MSQHNPYQSPTATVDGSADPDQSGFDQSSVFTAAGRFGRMSYLGWSMIIALVMIVLMLIAGVLAGAFVGFAQGTLDSGANIGVFVVIGLILIPMIAINIIFNIRRFHDMNMSGWWTLAMLVPIVGMIIYLILLIRPGTDGPNRFGPPRRTRDWETVLGIIYLVLIAAVVVMQVMAFGTLMTV